LIGIGPFAQYFLEELEVCREKVVNGKDLNLGDIRSQVPGGLECKMDISFLQKLCNLSGSAEFSIEVDVAANLPLGFLLDNLYELFGILMLHTALDFFQSHLPQVFNRRGRLSESED
jgi:hypothetical protein